MDAQNFPNLLHLNLTLTIRSKWSDKNCRREHDRSDRLVERTHNFTSLDNCQLFLHNMLLNMIISLDHVGYSATIYLDVKQPFNFLLLVRLTSSNTNTCVCEKY